MSRPSPEALAVARQVVACFANRREWPNPIPSDWPSVIDAIRTLLDAGAAPDVPPPPQPSASTDLCPGQLVWHAYFGVGKVEDPHDRAAVLVSFLWWWPRTWVPRAELKSLTVDEIDRIRGALAALSFPDGLPPVTNMALYGGTAAPPRIDPGSGVVR